MNKRSLIAIIVVSLVLLGAFLAACGETPQETTTPVTEQEPTALDGQSLVEERCTECHGLGTATGASKTEEEWRATVERMVGKGANLDAEEQQAVIQYLAETYPK
jgi:cytochrome c5